MKFSAIRHFTRPWLIFLAVGAAIFISIGLIKPSLYPIIYGQSLGYYLFWLSALLITTGAALGILAFVLTPTRALFGMGLGGYIWYNALSLPDGAIIRVYRDSTILSAIGAYLLIMGILATITHALSRGTGTQSKYLDIHNGSNGADDRTVGHGIGSTANGLAVSAGSVGTSGFFAQSVKSGYEEDSYNVHLNEFPPAVNIDGSPMVGSIDINGNVYGITSHNIFDNALSSGPSVNIDGSPMIGDVDIHGCTYGLTNDSFSGDLFGSDTFSSNSFGGDGFGNDSFSNGGFTNDSF